MPKQFKIGLYLLVLCAACLFAGKCLRMFTKVDVNTGETQDGGKVQNITGREGAKGLGQDGEEKSGSDVLLPEQRDALNDFSGNGRVLVLDAGHGAFDPGKVGVNGAKEKDINLAIAQKLRVYLEAVGFTVHMTRDSDDALYEEGDSNKKSADMRSRIRTMEEKSPEFAVSIHQNSFTQESSFGAQVFYFGNSGEGKRLAECLQTTIKNVIADDNHREPKANQSYYLLKKSPCPMVIVECGFLSNQREADLLVTEDYQDKMAWAICLGIVEYCRGENQVEM